MNALQQVEEEGRTFFLSLSPRWKSITTLCVESMCEQLRDELKELTAAERDAMTKDIVNAAFSNWCASAPESIRSQPGARSYFVMQSLRVAVGRDAEQVRRSRIISAIERSTVHALKREARRRPHGRK
jgi:hypothetical protein